MRHTVSKPDWILDILITTFVKSFSSYSSEAVLGKKQSYFPPSIAT